MGTTAKRLAAIGCSLAIALPAIGQATQPAARPSAAAPKAAAPAPAAPGKIDDILARWERSSRGIERLYAEFDEEDVLVVVGDKKNYRGKAFLQRPNLALLQFDAQDPDKPDQFTFYRRILCTGQEVLDFDAPNKQLIVYPLPMDARDRALEEGPLRFLFGMTVSDFKQRYQASLAGESDKTYRILLRPLQDVDRQAFSHAALDLNKETLLPDAVYLMSPNGKDRQTFMLRKITPNATWANSDSTFTFSAEKSAAWRKMGWRVIKNPPPGAAGTELEPAPRSPVGAAPRPTAPRPR